MGGLRSTMPALGAAAALVCVLSLAGPSPSHAAPPSMSGPDDASGPPCNELCKAYMAWSDRMAAMLRQSRPVTQTAVRDPKAVDPIVHRRASKPRQPSLNSFAQFPVRSDATLPSVETVQAEVAPSRPVEQIAERFPAAAGFVSAILSSTANATSEAPERTVVTADASIPPMSTSSTIDVRAGGVDVRAGGLDVQFVVSLSLALCAVVALVVRRRPRRRMPSAMR